MLFGTTLWDLIDARVDATPDALLAVDENMETLTFGEFAIEAERAAAGLANQGIGACDVVLVTAMLPWTKMLRHHLSFAATSSV